MKNVKFRGENACGRRQRQRKPNALEGQQKRFSRYGFLVPYIGSFGSEITEIRILKARSVIIMHFLMRIF